MRKFYVFFNLIIKVSLILPIIFIWINFYFRNFTKSIIFAIILTFLIILIIHLINNKKKEKKQLKSTQQEDCRKLSLKLLTNNNDKILNYFKNLYINSHVNNKLNFIKVDNENSKYIFPLFNKVKIKSDDILIIIKIINSNILDSSENTDNTNSEFNIICNDYELDIINLINSLNINIKIQKIKDIYLECNLENYKFDLKNIIKEKHKPKLNNLFLHSLNKKNSKKFALTGFTMLFFSFFSFYNIYYSIFASILFFIALYSYTNKKYN